MQWVELEKKIQETIHCSTLVGLGMWDASRLDVEDESMSWLSCVEKVSVGAEYLAKPSPVRIGLLYLELRNNHYRKHTWNMYARVMIKVLVAK